MFKTLSLRVFFNKPMLQQRSFSAACCIIGDEILNGKTRDSNAYYLGKLAKKTNVKMYD